MRIVPILVLTLFSLPATALDACRALVRLSDYDLALSPGVRELATEDKPAHCRVRGVINENIEFELRMPDEWSGRLLMRGTGGFSGYIADTSWRLEEGFAVVSTDTGHKGGSGEFLSDPKLAIDYSYRAVHLTTLAAKRIVGAYYDNPLQHSYFFGCSNGGRQGLLEALWYPSDYDGIVAGAPGVELTRALYWIVWAQQALTRNPIDAGKLMLIDNATRASCDGLDGVQDGIINDPRACTDEYFSPADLLCKDGQDPEDCLTPAEVSTLEKLYSGPVMSDGTRLSWGLAKGAEDAGDWKFWLFGDEESGTLPMNTQMGVAGLRARIMNDPDYDLMDFDLARDWRLIGQSAQAGDVLEKDLSGFKEAGGKLLIYQGWNDAIVRPLVTVNYVESVRGSVEAADDFLRLYMMPGMAHCGGGPGPDEAAFLERLVDWVERDETPERIIAERRDESGNVTLTRPLCPYPQYAHYSGHGATERTDNFACREAD